MEIVIGWFVFSIVAGVIASSKGRSGVGYFFLSLIVSPIIGIILAVALPKIEANTEAEALRSGDYRKCPMCAEPIRREALKCRFCGAAVPVAPPSAPGSAYDAGKALGEMFKRDGSATRPGGPLPDGQPGFGLFIAAVLMVIVAVVVAFGGNREGLWKLSLPGWAAAPASSSASKIETAGPRSSGWGFVMSSRYDYKMEGSQYAAVFRPPLRLTDDNIRIAMHSLAIDAFRLSDLASFKTTRVNRGSTTALAVAGADGHTYLFVPMKGRNELIGMGFWRE